MDRIINLFSLYLIFCVNIVFCFQRECDNRDIKNYTSCKSTHFQETNCEICLDKFNITSLKCVWEYDNITFEKFVTNLPEGTQYLEVDLVTLRDGLLPFKTYDIFLGYLVKLVNLTEFAIQTKKVITSMSFQINMTKEEIRNFKDLHYLTLFRITIPLVDKSCLLGSLIENLPKLKVLDLSNTRLLGQRNAKDIILHLNQTALKHLCLRKFQIPGGDGYVNNFTSIDILANISLDSLEEIDIAENGITNLPPVLSSFAPNLKYFDCSFNMLLNAKNWACFVDMILHPTLTGIKVNNQGYISKPSNYTQKQHSYGSKIKKINIDEYVFCKDCLNLVSTGNFSYFIDSGKKACFLVVCLLPTYFGGYNCENANTFPALNHVLCLECVMYVKFPIGKNLKSVHFSKFEFDKVISGGLKKFSHKGYVVLMEPNSLQQLSFHNNFEKKALVTRGFSDNIIGFRNLNNLTYVDLSGNGYAMKYDVSSKLHSLEHLDLSQNNFKTTNFCDFAPTLKFLNLSDNNITSLLPTSMSSCSSLETLDLSNNIQLNYNEYDRLNFNESYMLTKLILSNNDLAFLNKEFLNKLDQFSNITIDLQHNRLVCNCSSQSQAFIKWLIRKGKEKKLIEFEKLHCIGLSGSTFISSIENIDAFFKSCHESKWETVGISVGSTLGFIIFLAACKYCHQARWRIQYKLFNLRKKLQCSFGRLNSSEEKATWKYDAFISYCSEDRFWVHATLMKELEETYGFKLCIHYRDFPVGGSIAETIVDKMNESRDIIFILSDASLSRHWCNFELDQALSTRSSPIIIILGKINEGYLSSDLASLLDKQTYLQWNEKSQGNDAKNKLFWKKLVDKLYGNQSHGGCCCCNYDPEFLGYRDISEENTENTDEQKAEYYVTQIEHMLQTGNYSRIAFGPIPTSIEKLLKQPEKEHLDKIVQTHCFEKLQFIVQSLKTK